MNIQVKDSVGFSAEDNLTLAISLLQNRPPKEGSFNYGLETHGIWGSELRIDFKHPIQAYQSNKRKSDKSAIIITIERHYPL